MNLSALKSNRHQQVQIKTTLQLEQILRLNQIQMAVLVDIVTNMFLLPNAAMVNMLHQELTKQSQGQSFPLSEKIDKYINLI
jgi:hypothetical protein